MKVLIIEDEALSATRLETLLRKYDSLITVLAKIPSVKDSILWLENRENIRPDLIFLDLHLEDGLGFKIIDHLQLTIPIIFTTAYKEYTLRAFKTNGIDYLLKPIDPAELTTSLDKFKSLHRKSDVLPDLSLLREVFKEINSTDTFKDRFLASVGPKLFSVKTLDIAYFTIEQKATFLKTYDGKHLSMDYSLDRLLQLLDPKLFFRINRSLIVSLNSIRSITTLSAGRLKLDLNPPFGQEVYVSNDRISDFKQWLGK